MKRFLKYLFSCLLIVVPVVVLLNVADLYLVRNKYKVNIPDNKKAIAIGPSTAATSLNDSIISNICNMSGNGYTYPVIYTELRNVLKNNDIDTVYLSSLRIELYYPNSVSRNPGKAKIRSWYQWIAQTDSAVLRDYWLPMPGFIQYFFHFNADHLHNLDSLVIDDSNSGYTYLVRDNLYHGEWSIESYDEEIKKSSPDYFDYNHIVNDCSTACKYFKKCIDLCQEKGATVVLLNVPIYHYDRWYSDKGYLDFLETLDGDLLIADYEHFQLPDSCYGDVRHLNYKGARIFSAYLRDHGIRHQKLSSYISDRRAGIKNTYTN